MTAASKYPCRYGEDHRDGGEASPRPHRAIRLMDELGEEPPAAGKGRSPSSPKSCPPPERAAMAEALTEADRREETQVAFAPVQKAMNLPAAAPSPDGSPYAVLSVRPEGEGACVTVILRTPPSEEGGRPGRHTLHLLVEQYAELGIQVGEVTRMQAFALREAGALCVAIRRGLSMLACGDQSARRLAYKLTVKGVDREVAARAAAYLVDKGYICEENTARRRAEQSLRKLYGPRRIREDLRALGFSPEAVEETMDSLATVDFCENCRRIIAKKYGEIPEDRGERQKMIAAVMRLGYDVDTVREAMRRLAQESRS